MKRIALLTLSLALAGPAYAEGSAPDRKQKKSRNTSLARHVLGTLPKGWRVETTGLPARMAGLGRGPNGEIVVVSQLEGAIDPTAFDGDARTWLLGQLGARNLQVDAKGVFGSFAVTGVVEGPDRRARALRAWIVPGKPAWLVSWVGPADQARQAELLARKAARRWAGT